MTENHVEIVRAWFGRLAAGDPALDMCLPEIEVRNWSESPAPGPFTGHEGFMDWWRGVHAREFGESQMFELENVVPVDKERVVTIQLASGTGLVSGAEYSQRWASIITVRDGRIASAHGYSNPDAALNAAGIAKPRD